MEVQPRSGAVLIGVSKFADPGYPPVPAALNSIKEMRRILTDPDLCGWSNGMVVDIVNPENAGRVAVELRESVRQIEDVLLVYYVGHGQLTEAGALCLAMSDTIVDAAEFTGLGYGWLGTILRESPARVKITILDCCFSGQALQALAGSESQVADLAHINGVFTMTATTSNESAHVVPLAQQADQPTTFTGQLVELVEEGIPEGKAVLTIGEIYPVLRRRLVARGFPRPDQRGTDTVFQYGLTKNAAVKHATAKGSKGRPAVATPVVPEDIELPASLAARFTVQSEIRSRRRGVRILVAEENGTGRTRVLKLRPPNRQPRRGVAELAIELSQHRDGHRHLATLYEADLVDDVWYEVHEYCFHQSLRAVMDTGHRLDPVDVALEVCQALAYLEGRVFVVDLRPEGILARSLRPLDLVIGNLKLMRQSAEGLSRRARPSSSAYLPPEASQNLLTPAWDWWSVGMVIAEVALGRHPLSDREGKMPPERDLPDRVRYRSIDLTGITDPRVRSLCDGLLLRDRRRRSGRADVLRWIAGAGRK